MKTNIDDNKWESICLKCGQCCHDKHKSKYAILADPVEKCEHLTADNTCDIYAKRFEIDDCLSIEEALQTNLTLPASCPYTKLKPDYIGFVMPSIEVFNQILMKLIAIEEEEDRLKRDLTVEELQIIINVEK